MGHVYRYSVLAFEDEYGLWLRVPDLGLQLCAEDVDTGLDLLEEHLEATLFGRLRPGGMLPDRFERTSIEYVDKDGYGPTLVEIESRDDND